TGVDTISIANNHIGIYGQKGVDETIALLEANKVGWSGFGNLDIRRIKESKFGFLAFNGIGTSINRKSLATEIKEARPKVDVLVVSIHWGDEYVLTPRKYGDIAPDDPREIGHLIIDSGADLIIGNHPHTVQGVEIYKGKLITYAHGNFIFDQTWSQETQEGVVGEYTFYLPYEASTKEDEIQLVNVKFHPILVDKSYQPRLLNQTEGHHILDRMHKSSKTISTN
ncbi:CapA family protein, partial [Patescibacteria group bacterium]|nr:CapA family protein [Patescibacteria group bacterium]